MTSSSKKRSRMEWCHPLTSQLYDRLDRNILSVKNIRHFKLKISGVEDGGCWNKLIMPDTLQRLKNERDGADNSRDSDIKKTSSSFILRWTVEKQFPEKGSIAIKLKTKTEFHRRYSIPLDQNMAVLALMPMNMNEVLQQRTVNEFEIRIFVVYSGFPKKVFVARRIIRFFDDDLKAGVGDVLNNVELMTETHESFIRCNIDLKTRHIYIRSIWVSIEDNLLHAGLQKLSAPLITHHLEACSEPTVVMLKVSTEIRSLYSNILECAETRITYLDSQTVLQQSSEGIVFISKETIYPMCNRCTHALKIRIPTDKKEVWYVLSINVTSLRDVPIFSATYFIKIYKERVENTIKCSYMEQVGDLQSTGIHTMISIRKSVETPSAESTQRGVDQSEAVFIVESVIAIRKQYLMKKLKGVYRASDGNALTFYSQPSMEYSIDTKDLFLFAVEDIKKWIYKLSDHCDMKDFKKKLVLQNALMIACTRV